MAKHLLVFGGTGFLGSSICKYAVGQGIKVISISRTCSIPTEPWQNEIDYKQGDALDPSTYADLIPSAFAVIHSIGTLFESQTINLKHSYPDSYQHLNKDTALRICESIHGKNIHFVYISSERGLFFAPNYLSTKRDVEEYLSENKDGITSSVLRPGFLYKDNDLPRKIISCGIDILNYPDKQFRGHISKWVSDNFFPAKSLNADILGKVAVLCSQKEELKGRTFEVDDIENIAKNYK